MTEKVLEAETKDESKPYAYAFEINYALPLSPNRLMRSHWAIQQRHAKTWRNNVDHELRVRPVKPLKKAKIRLIRRSCRPIDFDNLVSSFKPVLDGLVSSRVIEDDRMSVLETEYFFEKSGSKTDFGIRVEIQEIATAREERIDEVCRIFTRGKNQTKSHAV